MQVTGESSEKLTQTLYHSHRVGMTWLVFAGIGILSAVMIYFYGRWIFKLARRKGTVRVSTSHV